MAKHVSHRLGKRMNAPIKHEIGEERQRLKILEMAMRTAPAHFPLSAMEREGADIILAASMVDNIKAQQSTLDRLREEYKVAPSEYSTEKCRSFNTKAEIATWIDVTMAQLRIYKLALRGLEAEGNGKLLDITV